jgi:HK97 family phage portal protein
MARWFWRSNSKGKEVQEGIQVYGPSNSTNVNFDSAMQVSAFWASARLITETVAAMPLRCYENDGDSRSECSDNDLFRLLNRRPNRYQTRTEFFESLVLNLTSCGNAYNLKQKINGRLVGLIPMSASQTEPVLMRDGSIVYKFIDANGDMHAYSEDQVWHVKLFGNGIVGMSPLEYAAKSLSTAIIQDDRNRKLANNGGKVAGYVKVDKTTALKKEQRDGIRAELQAMVSSDADFLPVLEMGAEFIPTGLSPSDTKLLESRRFSIEDIARFMGVPSVLINDTAGSTVWGSGISQLVEGFYKLNLRPYLERIESSIKRHLMDPKDFDKFDIEFDFDSLLRADVATRLDTYGKAVNSGQMSPNETRAAEGRPPKPGGDEIYLNGSLVPAGQSKEVSQVTGTNNEKI